MVLCEHEEIGATGRLRVLAIAPRDEISTATRFIGRWDEKANALDFDPVDGNGHVDKSITFSGHHPEPLPERRFAIDLRFGERIVFEGVVSFGLGRDVALEEALRLSAGFDARTPATVHRRALSIV